MGSVPPSSEFTVSHCFCSVGMCAASGMTACHGVFLHVERLVLPVLQASAAPLPELCADSHEAQWDFQLAGT